MAYTDTPSQENASVVFVDYLTGFLPGLRTVDAGHYAPPSGTYTFSL